MPKPTHWVLVVDGKETEKRYTQRHEARGAAIILRAQGHAVEVKAKGY
jgi:hypothetical protein